MLIVDSHEDLAWNMLTFGRDYTRSASDTRRLEVNSGIPSYNDDTLLGWPDYQRGRVGVIFATLFATPIRKQLGDWETQCYQDSEQAYRLYNQQLDAYHRLTEKHRDKFCLIVHNDDLDSVLTDWDGAGEDQNSPVGLVILMEGAEAIRDPRELDMWWERGLRLIGPAWAGTRFCGGTREPGPLTKEGFALLGAMSDLGFGLDLSHMDEQAALQAIDIYEGHIFASHSNALALLENSDSNRHLTDRQIHGLLERDAVIGVVLYNRYLNGGWRKGDPRDQVTLEHVVAQIDYICQIAGDAQHVGIGSDFDGGLGLQSVPMNIETVADIRLLAPLLNLRGYSDDDIAGIFSQNWIRLLRKILPE